MRVLDDGRLILDNNRSERELRRIAVGRNYAEVSIMQRELAGGTVAPENARCRRRRYSA